MKGFRGVWGVGAGFGGSSGGLRGVKRGLLYSQRALLSPLEVLYGTKFGSKHYIMDRMANVYKVCITLTHFGTFEPPLGAPKGPFHEQNKPLSGLK